MDKVSLFETRSEFEKILATSTGTTLYNELKSEWLNQIIPEINLLEECTQGTKKHLEGNVAVHTCLVFDNLINITQKRLDRNPDFIELFAVLLHDCRKPQTKLVAEDGDVNFPGHEELAAEEIPRIKLLLSLNNEEANKLFFLVAKHGEIHNWPRLSVTQQSELKTSPWIKSLAILQEADALSCLLPNGGHLPVLWDQIIK